MKANNNIILHALKFLNILIILVYQKMYLLFLFYNVHKMLDVQCKQTTELRKTQ